MNKENTKEPLSKEEKEDYIKYIILSFLLPFIGLIIGVVYMTKSDRKEKKMGETILCFSILFLILWSVLLPAILNT